MPGQSPLPNTVRAEPAITLADRVLVLPVLLKSSLRLSRSGQRYWQTALFYRGKIAIGAFEGTTSTPAP
jgi:hypothetical protein